jgi:DNA-binding NarL/FixJ family response regulator
MELVRVLVVEDFAPFRQLICSLLANNPNLKVIGEVSDGLAAVRTAEEFQPDLILLDIGLPSMNGIEAARRIRQLSPNSRILFVSQESSADVVEEALCSGALGYVVKMHAGSELLAAVEAVLRGTQFVSGGVRKNLVTGSQHDLSLLSAVPRNPQSSRNHKVQFCSDDESLVKGFARFIEGALNAGKTVIAIATEPHRIALLETLQAQGLNVDAAIERGSYIPLDVADTLATFMVNDLPDPVLFQKSASELLKAASRSAGGSPARMAACGECAPTLWAQGNAEAAIRLEHLWDEFGRTHQVDIFCGYLMRALRRDQEHSVYERICAEHSSVYSE